MKLSYLYGNYDGGVFGPPMCRGDDMVWGRFWMSPDRKRIIRVEPEGHTFYAIQIAKDEYDPNIKFDDPLDAKWFLMERGWLRIGFRRKGQKVLLYLDGNNITKHVVKSILNRFPDQHVNSIETEFSWM